jgi:hypothetical protein
MWGLKHLKRFDSVLVAVAREYKQQLKHPKRHRCSRQQVRQSAVAVCEV